MMKKNGFTLIELILYIAIVSIFVVAAITFAWDAVYSREKSINHQAVEQNGRAALARIAYEIRRAEDINSVSASSITLENGANDTTISLSSGVVQITTEGAGPYDLTSNQVFVTDLSFLQPGSSIENTKNIDVSMTLRQADLGVSEQFTAQTTMLTSAELNSQFNHARQLLIDLSGAGLTPNGRSITGITIRNTGTEDIIIDQIGASWSGTSGGEDITGIEIDGNSVWTGSQPSGSTLDITNFVLSTADGIVDVDTVDFDSQIDSGTVNFTFIFTDGSEHRAIASFVFSEDADSCLSVCQSFDFTGFNCRANVNQCNSNGETNQPTGDVFCTGGGGADTCCCVP